MSDFHTLSRQYRSGEWRLHLPLDVREPTPWGAIITAVVALALAVWICSGAPV